MVYTHLTLQPTVIDLGSIPHAGRQFVYTNVGGELNAVLKDMIGANPYRVEIELKPLGNAYSATGTIESSVDELCSLCAFEFKQAVKERFNEILVVGETPAGHGSHQARVNHSSELNLSGPECTELPNDQFVVGEFIRELIGLSRPIKPLGRPDCDSSCSNYQEALKKGWLTPSNETGFEKESPFAKLRDLKLNS
jgi:uncharacterized metal-binding protein YceD (DUF177 family)